MSITTRQEALILYLNNVDISTAVSRIEDLLDTLTPGQRTAAWNLMQGEIQDALDNRINVASNRQNALTALQNAVDNIPADPGPP